MYNNIGLMTPRGSGTSGYIQKSQAHIKRLRNRDEFIKELQSMKDNVIEARKKANPELLLHEQKRDIEVKKLELREALEQRGVSEQEIEQKVQNLENRLKSLLEKGEYQLGNIADTHTSTKIKEIQEQRISNAFGINSKDFKPGSAFDFDGQEKEKLEKQYERELKKAEKLLKLKEEKKAEKLKLKQEQEMKRLTDGIDFKVEDVGKEKNKSEHKEKKHKKQKK